MTDSRLYYESHITVQKPDRFVENHWDEFKDLMNKIGWRVSKFEEDEVDHIAGHFFASTKEKNLEKMKESVTIAIKVLEARQFVVLRGKIEDTVWDTKYGDTLEQLNMPAPDIWDFYERN